MKYPVFRAFMASTLLSLALFSVPGCEEGGEGDRCNPGRTANGEDECGSGLSCQQPTNCPENYCCPTSGSSSNPYCQTGCNGGDVSICLADSSQPFCAGLCAKDPSEPWCMSSPSAGAAGVSGT